MKTGFRGTFVISWSQTEIDGLEAAPLPTIDVGATWSWRGDAIRVDGPADVLRLDRSDGSANLRKRAARMVHRLVGAAVDQKPLALNEYADENPLVDSSFVVTDGAQSYTVTLIEVGRGAQPLLMFLDEIPPQNADLWVVHHNLDRVAGGARLNEQGGVICFTPGTRIRTPDGVKRVEDLREGDLVQTKDNGPQEIMWKGARRMTGARMFAMPHLRPIRIRMGALGIERPDEELLVSPNHRMLIQGSEAVALFNTPEILVAAKDLINGQTITVDVTVPEVTYIHMLLPDHQILWANGVETESFHPANAALSALDAHDRERLLHQLPNLEVDPHSYGDHARRNLSGSEAAIMNHVA
jgi:hypothetical protein